MARKLIVEIVGDSRSYERALGRSTKATQGFGRSMAVGAKNVAKVGAAMGAVAIGVGAVASRSFSRFETALSQSVALANVSQKEIAGIKDTILELGPETAKGPNELAEAFFFIAGAGLKGQKAVDALTASAKASAAGLGETLVVADAVTSAVNAYASTGLTATRATDILTAAVREGKLEASSLAPVIGQVLPTASALGIKFEDVAGVMALFSKTGTDAAEAATQVNAFLSQLLNVSPKVSKGLAKVGLTNEKLREVAAGPGGLVAVFQLLNEKFHGNVEAMRAVIPNVRAFRPLMNALAQDGKSVAGVMDGVKNSVGDTAKAFEIVSEDEAFKFHQALAQLQVIGIRLGAALAPLAKKAADAATAVLGAVDDIVERFGEAKTVRAKLNVVWEGVTQAGKKATDALKRAIGMIDWKAVFAGAKGIADELQAKLEAVDWGFIGETIGASIKKAAGVVFPAAQEIADRLLTAFRTIDWEKLGKAMGPGLAAAVTTAFVTLLDPAFWARNWDLALAVAITAFGGPVGKLGGIVGRLMLRPFARIGARLGPFLGEQISRGLSRLGPVVTGAVLQLVRLAGAAFGALTAVAGRQLARFGRWLAARFARFGRIARFTIKVLGIQLAINAIVGFGRRVYRYLRNLTTRTIPGLFTGMWNWLQQKAIEAALKIIEPFTHIPKRLGGGAFQDLKEQWKAQLLAMESDTDTATKNINRSFEENIHDRVVTVTVVGAEVGGHPPPAGNVPTPTTPRTRTTTATTEPDRTPAERETPAERKQRLQKLADKATEAFQETIDSLQLRFDKAVAAKRFKAAEDILGLIKKTILARISSVGKTAELARMLWENSETMKQTVTDANEATAEAVKAAQFQAIGLTATGEKKLPSGKSLLRRATGMLEWIKGTALDTKKNRAQLRMIVNFLKANYKKAGREVRQAIIDMLNDIKGAGDTDRPKGPLTKAAGLNTKKIIEGAGLDPDQARLIRSRLSGFNTAGLRLAGKGTRSTAGKFVDDRPIVIHTTVNLDGQKVATNTTRHQQRGRRRNPSQKRGPNKGGYGF